MQYCNANDLLFLTYYFAIFAVKLSISYSFKIDRVLKLLPYR